jgi:hypothetical protein
VLIALELGWIGNAASAAGQPLYPDLLTTAPSGLYVERGPDGKYLLRFANTAINVGGRMEITVASGSRDIYQNVYDQFSGGNRVIHQKIGADLIYHPQHNHFHFEDFAKYELLKRDSSGFYRATNRSGSKTSFCILDTIRVGQDGPTKRQYDGCGATVQGLSAGWGDSYIASLFGQWIELGTSMLPDGAYAIRSTADPDNKLMELNDFNNVGIAYFTIRNGRLAIDSQPPLCSVETTNGGATGNTGHVNVMVGSPVRLTCLRFGAQEPVDIHWGSLNTTPKSTATSSAGGAVFADIVVPQSSLGIHYVIARGQTSGVQAAAVVNTVPSISVTPNRGVVGTNVQVTLRGFSSAEQIDIRFYKTATSSSSVALVSANRSGGGSASFAIPATPFGPHMIEAVGMSSGARTQTSLVVMPSITEMPSEVDAGTSFGVALRGFSAGERVSFTLDRPGVALGSMVTSHSGSTTLGTGQITIPADVLPGEFTLFARGERSLVTVRAQITVRAPGAAQEPLPTPSATVTPEPTQPPAETPTPERTPTEPATPVPIASPVAQAPPDLEIADADGDGSERVTLDGSASANAAGGALTYEWTVSIQTETVEQGETLLSTGAIADITLSVGEHSITLTVTDAHGATATDQVTVRVLPTLSSQASP